LRPAVVRYDEVDRSLDRIIKSTDENKFDNNGQEIADAKRHWNEMLDDVDAGVYQFTIIIMTTNMDLAKYDDIDKSLLRQGRIGKRYTLNDVI
jgi:hypothetical protein